VFYIIHRAYLMLWVDLLTVRKDFEIRHSAEVQSCWGTLLHTDEEMMSSFRWYLRESRGIPKISCEKPGFLGTRFEKHRIRWMEKITW